MTPSLLDWFGLFLNYALPFSLTEIKEGYVGGPCRKHGQYKCIDEDLELTKCITRGNKSICVCVHKMDRSSMGCCKYCTFFDSTVVEYIIDKSHNVSILDTKENCDSMFSSISVNFREK